MAAKKETKRKNEKDRPLEVQQFNELVGNNIQRARTGLGLTQEALADQYGNDRSTINQWEKGRKFPPLMFLRWFWEKHHIAPEWIVLSDPARLEQRVVASFRAKLVESEVE